MRRLEVFFALIPIKYTLKLWGLSNEFIDSMILPSLALFLGTGNATPNLPTVMMERLYTSPTYGMWYKVDEHSLSSNLPPMVVFPESTKFYTAWKEDMEKKGVKVGFGTRLAVQLREEWNCVCAMKQPYRGIMRHGRRWFAAMPRC